MYIEHGLASLTAQPIWQSADLDVRDIVFDNLFTISKTWVDAAYR